MDNHEERLSNIEQEIKSQQKSQGLFILGQSISACATLLFIGGCILLAILAWLMFH